MQALLALVARLAIAAFFFWTGFQHLLARAETVHRMEGAGIPKASILYYAAVAVEIGGSLMLALGVRARLAALVLAGFLVPVTYFFHFPLSDPEHLLQFLRTFPFFACLLYITAFGAGRLSLDGK